MIFQQIDIAAAVIAALMVVGLGLFFQYTRVGRALRAVADDHQAALSVGISLEQIWVVVWFAAGIVALAAGIMWGARSDVSFALQIVALKALPVLVLGGLTSVPGAIVGGLIIGVGEKLGEIYWGPLLGGGIERLARLLHRPGLPAGPAAGPVRRADHRAGVRGAAHRVHIVGWILLEIHARFHSFYTSINAARPGIGSRAGRGCLARA